MTKNMKFWMVLIILLGIVGGLYIAFSKAGESVSPPLPTVKIGSVSAEVKQSTFCWSNDGQGRCEDHGLPEADDLQLVPVKPGDSIEITFHDEPKNFSFHRIENGALVPAEQVVPNEAGVYMFETGGEWEKGDSRYVFGVEVKE